MKKSVSIQVFGFVQGVWFRDQTKRKAEELGLVGLVKNADDGSVYIEAEGEEENVQKMVEWAKVGPPKAKVQRMEVNDIEPGNAETFEIWW